MLTLNDAVHNAQCIECHITIITRYVMHESEQRYTRNPLIISEYGLLKQRAESRKRAGSFFDSPVDSERFKTNYFVS